MTITESAVQTLARGLMDTDPEDIESENAGDGPELTCYDISVLMGLIVAKSCTDLRLAHEELQKVNLITLDDKLKPRLTERGWQLALHLQLQTAIFLENQ